MIQLILGLALMGASIAMLVRAGVGLAPWDVLHSGLTRHLPLSLGQMVIAASFAVLVLWLPLKEKPGIGTLFNAVLVGVFCDVTLMVLPEVSGWPTRLLLMLVGVLLNGVATAAYIGAQLGRGPRDGLMTGLSRRTGLSLRLVRTGLEVVVVILGVLLGGIPGIGTIVFALSIGPLAQLFLPYLIVDLHTR